VLKDFEIHVDEWQRKQTTMMFPVGVGTLEIMPSWARYRSLGGWARFWRGAGAQLHPICGVDLNGRQQSSRASPSRICYAITVAARWTWRLIPTNSKGGRRRPVEGLDQAFCDLGGQILTITSTSVEDLIDAKLHPERHMGLRVGWVAFAISSPCRLCSRIIS